MENKDKPAYPVRGANNAPIDMNDGFPWDKMSIGLTKREYAAIEILSGILSNPVYAENVKKASTLEILADAEQTVVLKAYSKLATDFADALLEQLNKG